MGGAHSSGHNGRTQAAVMAHTLNGKSFKLLPNSAGNVAVIGQVVRRFDVAPHTQLNVAFKDGTNLTSQNQGNDGKWFSGSDVSARGAVVSVGVVQL